MDSWCLEAAMALWDGSSDFEVEFQVLLEAKQCWLDMKHNRVGSIWLDIFLLWELILNKDT